MKLRDYWDQHGWRTLGLSAAAFLLLFLLAQLAWGAGTSATLTWTHPVAFIDGSALPITEIKETVIVWRRPGNPTVAGTRRVAGPATSVVVSDLVCGNFNFTASTVVKTNDLESAATAPVLYATGVQCLPNPPSGLGAS